jgi:hypothetical protein
MGLATMGLFVHLFNSNEFQTRNYGLIPMFVLILITAFYVIYKFIKYSPSIKLTENLVRINFVDYYWKDLEKIELTGKRPYIFLVQKEGMMLKFKDKKEITVLDDLYSNLDEIKLYIKNQIVDKNDQPITTVSKTEISEISHERFVNYKGNQFYNFRGITLWVIMGGLIYASLININHPIALLALFLMSCISFFGLSYFLYYFKISDNYLLVSNHNFFWVKKIYRLNDIKEIVFEQQDRWPNCLIVITSDFKSDFFPAASLLNKNWRQLKTDLENKDIKVRNEIYIG